MYTRVWNSISSHPPPLKSKNNELTTDVQKLRAYAFKL